MASKCLPCIAAESALASPVSAAKIAGLKLPTRLIARAILMVLLYMQLFLRKRMILNSGQCGGTFCIPA
ncbi:hypothetical protein D3C75_1360940 [compost metagenome]